MNDSTSRPVVLITGASSGIGAATARRFATEGFDIVAVARRAERLEQLAWELSGHARVAILAADVTEDDAPERAVDMAISTFGRLDSLINNAGSGQGAAVHKTDDAMLNEMVEINLKAPFRFCRAALRVLGSKGSIINVGSVLGHVGGLDGGAYCMVKAGLIGLTQTMAAQYGPKGIRSNLVAPGAIRTEMTDAHWEAEPYQRIIKEMTPFNREGAVEDIANAIYFLASDHGGYINGQTLSLDGGWSTTKFLSREAMLAKRLTQ